MKPHLHISVFLSILLVHLPQLCRSQTREESQVLQNILSTYERTVTPAIHRGEVDIPTVVNCSVSIRSLWSLSHRTMDFQVDLYVYEHWYDTRLNDTKFNRIFDINDKNIIDKIWQPDIYFPNSRSGNFQTVAVPNIMLRIYPTDGKVMMFLRCTMKFSCMMNLRKYPFDNQKCTMEISTFAKTDREVVLRWADENPVSLHPKISESELPEFEILKTVPDECDELYTIGNYSCLEATFYLSRRIGYHIVQNYIPTILIVGISWVSFWMDVDAVPGRVCLGITTLLTVTSKVTGVQGSMPEVSYVKAIDVWMGVCTAFVFCALCEFVLANYQARKERKMLVKVQTAPDGKMDPTSVETAILTPPRIWLKGVKVDKISRYGFPLAFLIFNIIYWPYYLAGQ